MGLNRDPPKPQLKISEYNETHFVATFLFLGEYILHNPPAM